MFGTWFRSAVDFKGYHASVSLVIPIRVNKKRVGPLQTPLRVAYAYIKRLVKIISSQFRWSMI